MVSGIIAVSGPMGWLLSYLEFNEIALAFVTSLSQSPTVVLLIIAAAMLLLGTFVDSLIVLLVFAPVAISISKTYGLDVYQVGLVMVMCNQIGAVSPPTAPLLFVTTSIAKTPIDETNRHVWTFMLAETLVLLLVILFPGLSSWIPTVFSWIARQRRTASGRRSRLAKQRVEHRADPLVARVAMQPVMPVLEDVDLRQLDRRLDDLQVEVGRQHGRDRRRQRPRPHRCAWRAPPRR